MNLFDLSGRVGLVTGGNGGIGLAHGRAMAAHGANIMVAGRNMDKNAAAVETLREEGVEAESVVVDVADEGSCQEMIAKTVERFGRLDILVNNAGTNVRKQPQDMSLQEWTLVQDVNLTSAFICAKAAYPHMCAVGGRIERHEQHVGRAQISVRHGHRLVVQKAHANGNVGGDGEPL